MIRVYRVGDAGFVEGGDVTAPETNDVVWVDLVAPSDEEQQEVIARFGTFLAEDATAGEIEATSRYFEDRDAIQAQLHFFDTSSRPPTNVNVAFAWRGGPLLSVHAHDIVAAQIFRGRAERQPELADSGISVLLGILESKVDRLADILEDTYGRLEQLSRRVLDEAEADLRSNLVVLADVEDQNAQIRRNLMDTQRVLNSLHRSDKLDQGGRGKQRLGEVLRDVESLLSHTAFLLEELSFLSDTIIGLINIEQNQIVKVLSVVAAVFLPPTLIASLYGMNFRHMPELSWTLGYPLAILLMAVLGAAPYLFAKWRGWM